jgi:hypothetical protein
VADNSSAPGLARVSTRQLNDTACTFRISRRGYTSAMGRGRPGRRYFGAARGTHDCRPGGCGSEPSGEAPHLLYGSAECRPKCKRPEGDWLERCAQWKKKVHLTPTSSRATKPCTQSEFLVKEWTVVVRPSTTACTYSEGALGMVPCDRLAIGFAGLTHALCSARHTQVLPCSFSRGRHYGRSSGLGFDRYSWPYSY